MLLCAVLASLRYLEHSYFYGGLNCLNSVPYRCYTFVLIIDIGLSYLERLQLHVSLVHVSACSFALSEPSDLELATGWVFNFIIF